MENLKLLHGKKRSANPKRSTEFYGDRVRVARALRALTQKALAAEVSTTPSMISQIESGKIEPSESLFAALAAALQFDRSFFVRPVRDEFSIDQCSFRHIQSTPKKLLDHAMAKGTLLQEVIQRLADTVEIPRPDVPSIPATSAEELESAADACRAHWELGLNAPIVNMIRVVEHAGIVVTRLKGNTEKVDAFSRYGEPPVIVLTPTRQCGTLDRFHVAHEVGHLVAHRHGTNGDYQSERQANRFAAAFLMPRAAFRREFTELPRVDWPHLFEMKRRWKVPAQSVLHRASELGLVDAITSRRLYQQFSCKGWHKAEPYDIAPEQPELIPLAIEIAAVDEGVTLENVADDLGWSRSAIEEITGLETPKLPDGVEKNVTAIDSFRKDPRE